MALNYSVRKKVDKSGDEQKELYYAVAKSMQGRNNNVSERELAERLAEISSLTVGDAMSVLSLLPMVIADYLRESRTVNIDGLGTFFNSLTSDGFETPEEVTADKVRLSRICYKADKKLKNRVMSSDITNIEWRVEKMEKNSKKKNK